MEPDLTARPVSYIDRARRRAAAAGREPHRWPHFASAPFARLEKPLAGARIGLVTTAALLNPDGTPPPEGRPPMRFATPASPAPSRLHVDHLGWDRSSTHMDDLDTYLPVHRLEEACASGRIGSASPRFYGVVAGDDAATLLGWLREDGVDAAILVPI